jgi:hypothetical protein
VTAAALPDDDTAPGGLGAGDPAAGLAVVPVSSGWHQVSTAP